MGKEKVKATGKHQEFSCMRSLEGLREGEGGVCVCTHISIKYKGETLHKERCLLHRWAMKLNWLGSSPPVCFPQSTNWLVGTLWNNSPTQDAKAGRCLGPSNYMLYVKVLCSSSHSWHSQKNSTPFTSGLETILCYHWKLYHSTSSCHAGLVLW